MYVLVPSSMVHGIEKRMLLEDLYETRVLFNK